MTKALIVLLATAATTPSAAKVPVKRPLGAETVITFAGNGGIRNYEPGQPGVVFLQDRQLRWYRVQLTGDCLQSRTGLDTLIFGRTRREPSTVFHASARPAIRIASAA